MRYGVEKRFWDPMDERQSCCMSALDDWDVIMVRHGTPFRLRSRRNCPTCGTLWFRDIQDGKAGRPSRLVAWKCSIGQCDRVSHNYDLCQSCGLKVFLGSAQPAITEEERQEPPIVIE